MLERDVRYLDSRIALLIQNVSAREKQQLAMKVVSCSRR